MLLFPLDWLKFSIFHYLINVAMFTYNNFFKIICHIKFFIKKKKSFEFKTNDAMIG